MMYLIRGAASSRLNDFRMLPHLRPPAVYFLIHTGRDTVESLVHDLVYVITQCRRQNARKYFHLCLRRVITEDTTSDRTDLPLRAAQSRCVVAAQTRRDLCARTQKNTYRIQVNVACFK